MLGAVNQNTRGKNGTKDGKGLIGDNRACHLRHRRIDRTSILTMTCGNHFWTPEKLTGIGLTEPGTNENSTENNNSKALRAA